MNEILQHGSITFITPFFLIFALQISPHTSCSPFCSINLDILLRFLSRIGSIQNAKILLQLLLLVLVFTPAFAQKEVEQKKKKLEIDIFLNL